MHCCSLPDACLETFPNPYAMKQWRNIMTRQQSPKQFRIHVAGINQLQLNYLLQHCMLIYVKEPNLPTRLRHLENDIMHINSTLEMRKSNNFVENSGNLTML